MLLYPCGHVNCESFFHLTFSLSAFLLPLSGVIFIHFVFLTSNKKEMNLWKKKEATNGEKKCMQEHTNTADMGKLKKASKYSLTQCHQLERIQYIHLLYQTKNIWIQSTLDNLQLEIYLQQGSEIQTTNLLFMKMEKIFDINEALEICIPVCKIYIYACMHVYTFSTVCLNAKSQI